MNRVYVLARKPQIAVSYLADEHLEPAFDLVGGAVLHAQAMLIELQMVRHLELAMRRKPGSGTGVDLVDDWVRRNRALEDLRVNILPRVRNQNDITRWVYSTELTYDWVLRYVKELAEAVHSRRWWKFKNADHPLTAFLNRVGLDGLRPISVGLPRGEMFGSGPTGRHQTDELVEDHRRAYEQDFDLNSVHWVGKGRCPWKPREHIRSRLPPHRPTG
jgi:hypothetical protein